MSKVAAYLRGHISGEVITREDVRTALASDAGVLSIKPELVVYPRTTNDIRKIARFSWQLAEKGHVLPLTVRGAGTDGTGAAIGKGAVVVTTAHMNKVFEYDSKQRRVRLQPGASASNGVKVQVLSSAPRLVKNRNCGAPAPFFLWFCGAKTKDFQRGEKFLGQP